MRTICLAAALAALSTAAVAKEDFPKGPAPAGRTNAAHTAGFDTLEACKQALYAEIAAQSNDPAKRPEAARATPAQKFAANQARMTECRAVGEGGKFRAFNKTPKPKA